MHIYACWRASSAGPLFISKLALKYDVTAFSKMIGSQHFWLFYDRICPTYLPYVWFVIQVIFVAMATGLIFFGGIWGVEYQRVNQKKNPTHTLFANVGGYFILGHHCISPQ